MEDELILADLGVAVKKPLGPDRSPHLPGRRGDGMGLLIRLYGAEHVAVSLPDGARATLTAIEKGIGIDGESIALLVPPLPPLAALASPWAMPWLSARLRAPDGCPWDREQTHGSLAKHLIEEAWELHDAIEALEDQVEALHAAASEFPLDLSRVAIRGWSFGGYLAALAVLRRPDVFHAAVAGAPVTEWRLYDTHYTERYLGDPSVDAAPYDRSSLRVLMRIDPSWAKERRLEELAQIEKAKAVVAAFAAQPGAGAVGAGNFLPVEFRRECGFGPGGAAVVGSHEIETRIMVGDAKMFLQRAEDDRCLFGIARRYRGDSGMEPAIIGMQLLVNHVTLHLERQRRVGGKDRRCGDKQGEDKGATHIRFLMGSAPNHGFSAT